MAWQCGGSAEQNHSSRIHRRFQALTASSSLPFGLSWPGLFIMSNIEGGLVDMPALGVPAALPVSDSLASLPSGSGFLADYAPYIFERLLGTGGFGEAVLARHCDPARPGLVVLKVPRGFSDASRAAEAARLLRSEARILCALHHPRIVRFLELVDNPVRDFIVVEFAVGGSLAQKLRGGAALPADEAARLVLDILQALEYVHLKGILHLDIT